jgi:hypothetical protein
LNRETLRESIQQQTPIPPRQIDDGIPPELERIVLKCLEKDPCHRYTTALDLAEDLGRWRRNGSNAPRRRMLIALALAVGAAIVVGGASVWSIYRSSVVPPLSGTLDLRRETPAEGDRAALVTLGQSPAEFTVSSGDVVQVSAQLNRPAFVYLLWIEADGNVLPVYPWTDLDWDNRPVAPSAADEVWRPEGDRGWMVDGPAGVETVVLLARDRPLPAEVDFRQLLAGLPALDVSPEVRLRGPRHDPAGPRPMRSIDDQQRRRVLEARLRDLFPLIKTVSFENLGEASHSP